MAAGIEMDGGGVRRVAVVPARFSAGGFETFMFRLGRYLVGEGMAVEFVVTEKPGEWYGKLSELGFPSTFVEGFDSLSGWGHFNRAGRLLAAGHYDAVLLCHSRQGQATLGMLDDEVAAVPILANHHEVVYKVGLSNAWAWNAAVGCSPRVRDEAAARAPGRLVRYIPWGIELPGPVRLEKRRPWAPELRLLFAGRINQGQKNVFLLPQIVRGCVRSGVNVSLAVAGDGPDMAEFRGLVGSAGIGDRVKFLGMVSPDEVYELLLGSHVLLLPSFFEGLPIIALEAQACGCVPVASLLPGITDEAVADEDTGYLAPVGDVDGFVSAVCRLGRSGEEWSRLSHGGRARAAEKFSVEAMGRAYLALLEEIWSGGLALPRSRSRGPRIDRSLLSWKDVLPSGLRSAGRRFRRRLNFSGPG